MALRLYQLLAVSAWLRTAAEAWVFQPSSFIMAPRCHGSESYGHHVRRWPGRYPPPQGLDHSHSRRATVLNAWYISQKFYDDLGVDRQASEDEIRRAFRLRAAACHPDRDDSPEARAQFEKVNIHS